MQGAIKAECYRSIFLFNHLKRESPTIPYGYQGHRFSYTIGKGQRMGIFAGSGVEKRALGMMVRAAGQM